MKLTVHVVLDDAGIVDVQSWTELEGGREKEIRIKGLLPEVS